MRAGMPAFGLRSKLALVALALLVIPWVGYSYVRAMEHLLRENQEQQIAAAARAVAAGLQDRPRLLALGAAPAVEGETPPLSSSHDEANTLVAGLARPGLRIWVIDRKLRLIWL